MAEYAERFAENRIDLSVLPDLTEEDLKELGVVLGDRRRLLRAIADLKQPPAPVGGERRQVTLMFCDLVGSTSLSTRLDPEDLREIIGTYHRTCARLVESHGGYVAKYMGDGVLAYFGYPHAHENDAERAVQAGLAIAADVPGVLTAEEAPLRVRVGIATGTVVVGDLLGSGEAQERGVVGETPNLAARLQGVAEPGMVVIADSTRRLLGGLFDLRDLGPQDLKGMAEPVQAWAALRARPVESRFEALHGAGLGALVGRGPEIDCMLRCWNEAKTGIGKAVLLSGEAGIGKSRLVAAVLEHVAAEPHERQRFFCSPQHTDSAFHPVIGQIERTAGLTPDDPPAAKLDKLMSLLAPADEPALLAELLSLPEDGRLPVLDMPGPQRRLRTMELLVSRIEALSRSTPVLMVFEDAHWSDPTTLELLGRIIDRIRTRRVLLLMTARPEFVPPWPRRPHVTSLVLERMNPHDAEAMIARISGDRTLPASIRRDILERSDGVPLFVEEMTKAVMEAASPTQAVPASLHASLQARLDRLGAAKEIAQAGAAIGREFSHGVLASVVRRPDAELDAGLDRLTKSGLLFRDGTPPDALYQFKHALVRDAAYGTLLRDSRRALHARIAEVMEIDAAATAENRPELLARHWTEAGAIDKAADYWDRAGRRSLARSALVEAAEQLGRALAQIETLPGTPALRRRQIRIQLDVAHVLIHIKGHASPEMKAAFEKASLLMERAEALGEPPDDPLALFAVLYGFWVASRMNFNAAGVRDLAAQFLSLAEKQAGTAPIMIGHMLVGISAVLISELVEGRSHLDRALALYMADAHRPLATRFGHDVRATALSWRAMALWLLGETEEARAGAEAAVACARETGHVGSLMFALSHAALTLLHCGDFARTQSLADELIAVAEDKGTLYWKAYGQVLQGWVQTLNGDPAAAVEHIAGGLAAIRSTGASAYGPFAQCGLAEANLRLGRLNEARRCIEEARTAAETTGESWGEPEIHRLAGEIAVAMGDLNRAEQSFTRALEIARARQARSFELRVAKSLAGLKPEMSKA
ncbi:MAG: AAA family ATPase [Rhodospirillaceae bacterium]|nr:AAA family ATPase [Rhodospirillaceae bacterium]